MSGLKRMVVAGALAVAVFPVTVRAVFYSENLSFEGVAIPVPQREVFQDPTYSGSTRGIKPPPVTLPDLTPYAIRTPEWEGSEGIQSLGVVFTWGDSIPTDPFTDDPYAWVRLTTNAGAVYPNPTVDLRGKIRFKVRNPNLGIDRSSIGLCVAIRETGVQANLLGNGGVAGSIEWIGVSTALSVIEPGTNGVVDAAVAVDDIAWVVGADTKAISWGPNGVLDSVPAGDDVAHFGYIRAPDDGDKIPIPAVTIPTDLYDWTQVEVDLSTGKISYAGGSGVGAIAGLTGDGVLSTANYRAVLEALCITNDVADAGLNVGLYIDELQIEAPAADPTPPPSVRAPVFQPDTQVLVDCLVSGMPGQSATLAQLFIDSGSGPVSAGPAVPAGGVATFSPVTLAIGDILTAKQTANGLLSAASAPVVVYGVGTVIADSFDTYDTQAELEVLWPPVNTADTRKLSLSTAGASSCQNAVISDFPTTPSVTVSRLYRLLGGVNGTNAQPLVVTYRFKHDYNSTSTRARFELTPAPVGSPGTRTYGAVGFAFSNGLTGAGYGTQYCTMANFPNPVLTGYQSDYFSYDYARTGVTRVPGVWHKMQIEVKTSVLNFYIDDVKVNTPYDDAGNPISTNGVPIFRNGVPRQNANPFNYIVLGCGYNDNGPATMYDDISVTLGSTPIPFGPPNPVASPNVVGLLFPGVTTVNLADVNSNATLVEVFANGAATPIGTATGPFLSNTAAVTVTPMVNGSSINATQTDGGTSCLSLPVVVAVPAVTLQTTLVPGQTSVQVSALEQGLAEAVTIWKVVAGVPTTVLGTVANPATDPVTVTVTPLVNGDIVAATQTIGGVEGPLSTTRTVAVPAPSLQTPISVGNTTVTVTGVHPLATSVKVYVNANSYSATAGGPASVAVTVPALVAGDVVKATQTIGGVEGPFSATYIVANYLVVNEFQYDDDGTDDYQFVELYNKGPTPIDISGYKIELGDTAARQTVTIPASTTIASLGYWTVGQTAVGTLPGAVVNLIKNDLNLGDTGYYNAAVNGEIYVAVRNPSNTLLDAAAVETNKSLALPADVRLQLGPGIWGNALMTVSGSALATDGRLIDGLDTDNNGRDFGIMPATPGYSNTQPDRMPYLQNGAGLTVGANVPYWYAGYTPTRAIDPTVADTVNPEAIAASPDGGLALIVRDTPGGNATFLSQLAKEDFSLETWVYVKAGFTTTGYEEWKIGIRGTSDGLHNFDWYNGSTGLCWFLQRGTSWQAMWLLDENDGDDGTTATPICATILGTFTIGTNPALTGWQRLLLETKGNRVRGIFGGTYGSRADGTQFVATHASPGVGGVWITHRESTTGEVNMRPPTLDAFSLKAPPEDGDIDGDGDVDLSDLAKFVNCLNGPNVTTPPVGCSVLEFDAAKLDADNDVDLLDFAEFQVIY